MNTDFKKNELSRLRLYFILHTFLPPRVFLLASSLFSSVFHFVYFAYFVVKNLPLCPLCLLWFVLEDTGWKPALRSCAPRLTFLLHLFSFLSLITACARLGDRIAPAALQGDQRGLFTESSRDLSSPSNMLPTSGRSVSLAMRRQSLACGICPQDWKNKTVGRTKS